MADEVIVIIFGILIAIVGVLLIISPVIINAVISLTGIKAYQLQDISITALFGGGTLAVVAMASRKKPKN
jgi:hypothetical protein